MPSTPECQVFQPDQLVVLASAISAAYEERPDTPVTTIANRILAAASSGVTDPDELKRAGISDD